MSFPLQRVVTRSALVAILAMPACAANPSGPAQVSDSNPPSSGQAGEIDAGPTEGIDDADGDKPSSTDSGRGLPKPKDAGPAVTSGRDAAAVASDGAAAGNGSPTDAQIAATDGSASAEPDETAGLWISPTGSDQAPGTKDKPLQSLKAAHDLATPGSTIWVSPGTYALSDTVKISRSGQPDKPILLSAAPGARPVFDFSAQARGASAARGLQISGDYWHIRGIEVINAGDNCINISGSNNTIERVVIHGCCDTGLQITADGSAAGDATRAAHNTILNTDSYENYDTQNQGENADGFAAKLHIGPGNVFRGCRSWNNSDDGWDLFASNDVVVIENSWAIANGKIGASQNNTNGDGNGFKLGGAPALGDADEGGAVHQVKNCVSLGNKACGFVRNNNPELPQLTNCSGQGDGAGAYCKVTSDGSATVSMTAAQAIAATRDADGNLPPM